MGDKTKIEWCDHTFNPWWGCESVSDGCRHCYAKTFAHRQGFDVFGHDKPRRYFGENHWAEPYRWDHAAAAASVRRRVFCGSMCDVFEDRPDLFDLRAELLNLIRQTRHLDWLLLTKRSSNVGRLLEQAATDFGDLTLWTSLPRNLWLGVTVESEAQRDRLGFFRDVACVIQFCSCEPLLGPVDIRMYLQDGRLDWVIVGGESGPGARPMHPDWVRDIRDQCNDANVPFFFKQWGGVNKHKAGRMLDGREWNETP